MPQAINISGRRYGRLLAIRQVFPSKNRQSQWLCECNCGLTTVVALTYLRTGHTQSCGCLRAERMKQMRFMDMTGCRFGRLVVKSLANKRRKSQIHWNCECECGTNVIVAASNLRSGNSNSCGCLQKQTASDRILVNLTGQRIRKWTVIGRAPKGRRSSAMWLCRHDDGRECVRSGEVLRDEKDDVRNLIRRYRTIVYTALKNQTTKKFTRTIDLLGCTGAELASHLSSMFEPGMTLDNHGEWHIDHIIPIASFDLTDPEQLKACFHYTNLQPLWAADNLSKSDRLDWTPPRKQPVTQGV